MQFTPLHDIHVNQPYISILKKINYNNFVNLEDMTIDQTYKIELTSEMRVRRKERRIIYEQINFGPKIKSISIIITFIIHTVSTI